MRVKFTRRPRGHFVTLIEVGMPLIMYILGIQCVSLICRSLGVHVSKVRSLTLDAWEPEQIKVNQSMNRKIIRSYIV